METNILSEKYPYLIDTKVNDKVNTKGEPRPDVKVNISRLVEADQKEKIAEIVASDLNIAATEARKTVMRLIELETIEGKETKQDSKDSGTSRPE